MKYKEMCLVLNPNLDSRSYIDKYIIYDRITRDIIGSGSTSLSAWRNAYKKLEATKYGRKII
jgi:hypothetical protein